MYTNKKNRVRTNNSTLVVQVIDEHKKPEKTAIKEEDTDITGLFSVQK